MPPTKKHSSPLRLTTPAELAEADEPIQDENPAEPRNAKPLPVGGAVAGVRRPVEANFLCQCIADDLSQKWDGPYPLIDIASVRFAAGFDPLAKCERLPNEISEHDPLSDSMQSARLLLEALDTIEFELNE